MQNKIIPNPKTQNTLRHPKMPEELRIRTRKAKVNDISAIASIEQQQFPHPWKKSYLTDELSHDISYFYIAEDILTNQVVGYIIFWIVEDLLELHKIVTAENYKRKGIGKKLFLFMLEIAKQKKVKEVFLEVRKSNNEAIKFYESFHFELAGIRKDYYQGPMEEALIFRRNLKFNEVEEKKKVKVEEKKKVKVEVEVEDKKKVEVKVEVEEKKENRLRMRRKTGRQC